MLNSFIQYAHSKIMSHRNGKRLWIQGARPDVAGFVVGAKYDVVDLGDSIKLVVKPNGKFTVSRKAVADNKFVPILDVRLSDSSNFSVDDRIRIVFSSGTITVTIHHEAQAKLEREKRFISNIQSGALKKGSLCTGGGVSAAATAQAVTDAGVNAELSYVVDESLKYLSIAGANNFAITDETAFFASKLEEVEPAFIERKLVDLLSFSLPCAGLSRSGAAKHKLSPEEHGSSTSIFGLMNFIRCSNPAVLWSENVVEAMNSPLYTVLKAELLRRGYRITEDVTSNEKTGSLEARSRYWFLAVSDGLDPMIDADVFDYYLSPKHASLNEIRDEEADADESQWAQNEYLKIKQVRDAAAGKGFAKRQLLSGEESKVGCIGRHYNKRRSTEPMWVRDDGSERLLSLKEHCAVKQVPFSLVEGVCNTIGHEILGQGIDYMQCYMPILRFMKNVVKRYALNAPSALKNVAASNALPLTKTKKVVLVNMAM